MTIPDDRTTFAPELTATYRRIWALVNEAMEANKHALVLDYGRHATLAGIGLLAKARKSAAAVLRLAEAGYGEDALIVTRSLVNLTIDLAYIADDPALSDDRARDWYARGIVARHDFLEGLGQQDRIERDWAAERVRARRWKGLTIEVRATRCGLEDFYRLPYRHGSVFEHSDSWGASNFLEDTEAGIHLTGVGPRFVDLALLSGACALGEVGASVAKLFGFVFDREKEAIALVKAAFGEGPPTRRPRPGG